MDVNELAGTVLAGMRRYVERSSAVIHSRLKDLEGRPLPERGERGEKGVDGISGRDGRDGVDGKSVDLASVELLVKAAVGAIEKPANGKDGINGKDGARGSDGKDGINGKDADSSLISELKLEVEALRELVAAKRAGPDMAEVAKLIASEMAKALSSMPTPKDGRDGKDADPVLIRAEVQRAFSDMPKPKDGEKGERGEEGYPGRDGRDGVQGDKGLNGRDGKDGINVEDIHLELKDGQTVVWSFRTPTQTITKEVTFPVVIDSGTYKSGEIYRKGCGVTYGGSFWIAQSDTNQIPGKSKEWRLAVQRGRDGGK